MPMLFARRDPDDVAWPDLQYRTAFGLEASDAIDDVKRLTERMGVPIRSRARLEGHATGANPRWRRCIDNRILPDRAGKAIFRRAAGRPRAGLMKVHGD